MACQVVCFEPAETHHHRMERHAVGVRHLVLTAVSELFPSWENDLTSVSCLKSVAVCRAIVIW
jgi:hypothetical protein